MGACFNDCRVCTYQQFESTLPPCRDCAPTMDGGSNFERRTNLGRQFESGAYRDTDADKLDFEGFLSPAVLQMYAEYMHKHRKQSNGEMRDSDNWQLGLPTDVCMKSLWRHFFDVWCHQRGVQAKEPIEDALCGVLFNTMAIMHNLAKAGGFKEGDLQP